MQDLIQQTESSLADFHAKICPLQAEEQDLVDHDQDYSGRSVDYLTKPKRKTLFSKTSLDFSHLTKDEIWEPLSERWKSGGIASRGVCLTLNTLESPKDAVESSLSDVLETTGEHLQKYLISKKAAMGILRRSTRGKGQLPILLQQALELVASNDMD
jgi:hypothetical protein